MILGNFIFKNTENVKQKKIDFNIIDLNYDKKKHCFIKLSQNYRPV